jgi:hypothetical protein
VHFTASIKPQMHGVIHMFGLESQTRIEFTELDPKLGLTRTESRTQFKALARTQTSGGCR